MWDEAELPHIVEAGGYRVLIYGTDVSEHPEGFDAIDFIDRAVEAVGCRLSEEQQDGKSYCYAVLNLGGKSRADTLARCEEALRHLPFAFEARQLR